MNSSESGSEGGAPRSSGGAIGFAVALVVLAVIIVALLFARPPTPPSSGGAPVIPQAKVGATKHIGSAAAREGIACLMTRPKLDDMISAGRAGDFTRVSQDIADAAILHPGDGVRVLERFGPSGKFAKLQIVSGGSTGRVCFTEIDAPDFLT